MKISLFPLKGNFNSCSNKAKMTRRQKLAPSKFDTVSFCSINKNQLKGIDFAVADKFKAPISSFSTIEDYNLWLKNEINKITQNSFEAKSESATLERKKLLSEWFNYVLNENDAYTPAIAFIVLSAIVKDLKDNNNALPPVLNRGALADCTVELSEKLNKNQNETFDFAKLYNKKLIALCAQDEAETGEVETKWIVIPSKDNDPENFEENIEKLKILSHKNWCTKSLNAKSYLERGDFHIYLEKGKPRIGLSVIDGRIEEIQDEKNNNIFSIKYLDIFEKHKKDTGISELSSKALGTLSYSYILKNNSSKIKEDLKEAIENRDIEKILNYFNIKTKRNENNELIALGYNGLQSRVSFDILGIKEEEILKSIYGIEGDLELRGYKNLDLENLHFVSGNVNLISSSNIDLSALENIEGSVDFSYAKNINLSNLKTISKDLNLCGSKEINTPNLKDVKGRTICNYEEFIDSITIKPDLIFPPC